MDDIYDTLFGTEEELAYNAMKMNNNKNHNVNNNNNYNNYNGYNGYTQNNQGYYNQEYEQYQYNNQYSNNQYNEINNVTNLRQQNNRMYSGNNYYSPQKYNNDYGAYNNYMDYNMDHNYNMYNSEMDFEKYNGFVYGSEILKNKENLEYYKELFERMFIGKQIREERKLTPQEVEQIQRETLMQLQEKLRLERERNKKRGEDLDSYNNYYIAKFEKEEKRNNFIADIFVYTFLLSVFAFSMYIILK